VLASATFLIILFWPDPSAEAVRRAAELNASVLVVPPASPAPAAPPGIDVITQVPVDSSAIASAKSAGFRGVFIAAPEEESALRALLKQHGAFIRFVSLAPRQAHWDVSPAQPAVRAGHWPGLQALDSAAGATELPWINANLHHYAWLEGFFPRRVPALDCDIPADTTQYEGAEILLSEAWAFGAPALLRLPEPYREALAKGDPRAAAAWDRLREVATFLRSLGKGAGSPASSLAVLVPEWDEEYEEILNLAWRQQLSPRALPLADFAPPSGLRLVAVPNRTPPPAVEQRLRQFASTGGIVLVAPEPGQPADSWRAGARETVKEGTITVHRIGRGSVRVMDEPALDPFVFALDLREQLGLDNPLGRGLHGLDVRIWHASTVLPVLRRAPDGSLVAVLIGYGRWIDHDFLAGARGGFRSARLAQPGAAEATLRLMLRGGRVEWNQPGLRRIAAVTLEEAGR
jgi:hypothetical protein